MKLAFAAVAATALAATLVTTPLGSAAKTPAFSFVGGGDIATVGTGATTATFAGIHRFLHGDLVMANLEGTLASGGSAKCAPYGSDGCYTFRAAPSSAHVLRAAGFTSGPAHALLVRHLTLRALRRREAPALEPLAVYGVKGFGSSPTRLSKGEKTHYAARDH